MSGEQASSGQDAFALGPHGDEIVVQRDVNVDLCTEDGDGNVASPCPTDRRVPHRGRTAGAWIAPFSVRAVSSRAVGRPRRLHPERRRFGDSL
jgi:hypothetical protein